MADNLLSQEDMNRLLQEAEGYAVPSTEVKLSDEKAALLLDSEQEISVVVSEAIASQLRESLSFGIQELGTILSRKAEVGDPVTEQVTKEQLDRRYNDDFVAIVQNISGFFSGELILLINQADALALATIITKKRANELASKESKALQSLFSPMFVALCNRLMPAISADIYPGKLEIKKATKSLSPFSEERWLKLELPFHLENEINSKVNLLLPTEMAREIYQKIQESNRPVFTSLPEETVAPGQLGIKEIHFPSMDRSDKSGGSQPNLNLLMDVQMTLKVELGRTKMYIKEILGLGEGSIIELDKLAGEPVDLLVSDKLIAKGEVVVIDENFGVRVTDIVSPIDRISQIESEDREE